MRELIALVVLATATWVAVDASRLGARQGTLGGGLLDMGPAGWFFACAFVWIVSVPCYLVARPRLVRRAKALAGQQSQFAGAAPAPFSYAPMAGTGYGYPPAPGPAAGWYQSPDGHGLRWWDGMNWTGHSA